MAWGREADIDPAAFAIGLMGVLFGELPEAGNLSLIASFSCRRSVRLRMPQGQQRPNTSILI
jgi:hypothetical protein